jgi:hypothetical protein
MSSLHTFTTTGQGGDTRDQPASTLGVIGQTSMEQVTKIISDAEEAEGKIEIEITERLSEEDLQMMNNPPQSAQSMARVGEKK